MTEKNETVIALLGQPNSVNQHCSIAIEKKLGIPVVLFSAQDRKNKGCFAYR